MEAIGYASKRKRVNRSAKLKQCKLDARREQWLSQGMSQFHASEGGAGKQPPPSPSHKLADGFSTGDSDAESCVDDWGSFVYSSAAVSRNYVSDREFAGPSSAPVQAPIVLDPERPSDDKNLKQSSKGFKHKQQQQQQQQQKRKSGRIKCKLDSSSDDGGGGGLVGEATEVSQVEDDDWEAAADALNCQINLNKVTKGGDGVSVSSGNRSTAKYGGLEKSKAWRADDVLRPATLPKPAATGTRPRGDGILPLPSLPPVSPVWGMRREVIPMAPAAAAAAAPSCPICTEELDSTDSSFQPCACGFRLCLFCYHRIAAEDGRCPGCRKSYNIKSKSKAVGIGLRA